MFKNIYYFCIHVNHYFLLNPNDIGRKSTETHTETDATFVNDVALWPDAPLSTKMASLPW